MPRRLLLIVILSSVLVVAPVQAANDTVAQAINAFAVDLYAHLHTREGNLFFSPASIAFALAMTRSGARGHTAEEMDRVLHLEPGAGGDTSSFGELINTIVVVPAQHQSPGNTDTSGDEQFSADAIKAALARVRSNYTLRLANRIYGREDEPFRSEFLDVVANHFKGGFELLDFEANPGVARLEINRWVADRTDNRICDLLPPDSVDRESRLVLVNAIYFRANWMHAFPADSTRPRPFHLTRDETVEVPTMERTGSFEFAEFENLQVLVMPYRDTALEMVILLPSVEWGLAGMEENLTAENLLAWLAAPDRAKVAVALPRFATDSQFDLGRTLATMGMPSAFTPQADFGGMTDGVSLFLNVVAHKANIGVDEEGTEAAAATAVVATKGGIVWLPGPPEVFRADRPFLYLIRHGSSGVVLFLGRMEDPRG